MDASPSQEKNKKDITQMFARLKTSLWVPALIRRAETAGAFAAVSYKGDPDAGAALIKVRSLDGLATLYRPMQSLEGTRIWLPQGPSEEAVIDGAIATRVENDPDIWVVEIDDRQGRHFLTEPVDAD